MIVGDPFQYLLEINFSIEYVAIGCVEQRVHRRGVFYYGVGAGKKEVLAIKRDDAQCACGSVVVDFEVSIVDVAGQRTPARERVANCRRGVGFRRELGEHSFEPGAHAVEQRPRPGLPNGLSDLRRTAADLGFDGVECGDVLGGDVLDGFAGRWRNVSEMDLVELSTSMRARRSLLVRKDDGSPPKHRPGTHLGGARDVAVDARSRGRVTGKPIVANVSQEPSCPGLAVTGLEHRYRGVVSMQLACRHDTVRHNFDQQSQQFAGCADPSGKRGTIAVAAFAGIDLRLSIEQLMIGILRDQHMREQTWACESTIDGA